MFLEKLEKLKLATVDGICVNTPWTASFAFVKISEVKDWISVLCMLVGAVCTILVTRHRMTNKKKDDQ